MSPSRPQVSGAQYLHTLPHNPLAVQKDSAGHLKQALACKDGKPTPRTGRTLAAASGTGFGASIDSPPAIAGDSPASRLASLVAAPAPRAAGQTFEPSTGGPAPAPALDPISPLAGELSSAGALVGSGAAGSGLPDAPALAQPPAAAAAGAVALTTVGSGAASSGLPDASAATAPAAAPAARAVGLSTVGFGAAGSGLPDLRAAGAAPSLAATPAAVRSPALTAASQATGSGAEGTQPVIAGVTLALPQTPFRASPSQDLGSSSGSPGPEPPGPYSAKYQSTQDFSVPPYPPIDRSAGLQFAPKPGPDGTIICRFCRAQVRPPEIEGSEWEGKN